MDVKIIPRFKQIFMSRKERYLFRYLVSKLNSGTDVLCKFNEIKKLVLIHRNGADNIIDVSFIDPRYWFVLFL